MPSAWLRRLSAALRGPTRIDCSKGREAVIYVAEQHLFTIGGLFRKALMLFLLVVGNLEHAWIGNIESAPFHG